MLTTVFGNEHLGGWKDVEQPAGFTPTLPFTIQRKGRKFRAKNFDLRSHANVTVSKTYYVDIASGLDTNSGADWDNALKTVIAAKNKGDADRIYIKPGFYHYSQSANGSGHTRSVELIGVGDGVYLTGSIMNAFSAWSAVDNHYEATWSGSIAAGWDASIPDANGYNTKLTQAASVAEVDANPGTYYSWVSGTGYMAVRLPDDRAPDENVIFHGGYNGVTCTADAITIYVENINFWYLGKGGQLYNASAAGGTNVYYKDCTFRYLTTPGITFEGITESIMQNCRMERVYGGDAINYTSRNTVVGLGIEIDCTVLRAGENLTGSSSWNCSTSHGGVKTLRIGGEYAYCGGPVIADINNNQAWLLGVYSHDPQPDPVNSAQGDCFQFVSTAAYFDRCMSGNPMNSDIEINGTGYKRLHIPTDGTFTVVSGTLEDY